MERSLPVHISTRAAENMAGTVVQSDSDDTEHKLQHPSKTIVKSLPDTRSKTAQLSADLGVMTKNDVEAIVKSHLTQWTSNLQSQIVKTV